MIREAELEEMEKKWREENERIMRDHPLLDTGAEMMPLAAPERAPEPAPGWEQQAVEIAPATEAPQASEPAWPAASSPEPPAPEVPAHEVQSGEISSGEPPAADPSAPELPLGPPVAAPGRALP
jgi:sec-independent protein translocase protein TatB